MAYDISITMCRQILAEMHAYLRKIGIKKPMRAAWVHHSFNQWEFHGPDGFYWNGRAHNAYDARLKGWKAWLRRYYPCKYCDCSGVNPAYQPPRFLDEGETYNENPNCPDCEGKGYV